LIFKRSVFQQAIQVCYVLNQDNLKRELQGILEALEFFGAERGLLITLNQSDRFEKNGKIVEVIPAHLFCSEE
jgi:uncharacterized protein